MRRSSRPAKARRSSPTPPSSGCSPRRWQVRALKAQPIGIVLETPIRRLLPASPLGNLVTDAYLAAVPGADVA